MKYRIQRSTYRDFALYEHNKRGPRAYFIPYGREDALRNTPARAERYHSDLVQVLSGQWRFRYFADSADLPKELDTDSFKFHSVQVPHTWQRPAEGIAKAYEPPVYLNSRFEFEDVPPALPEVVPAGLYCKSFTLPERNKERSIIIAFLGACACVDLYCNGYHIGYSEGAHNTAEFDLSAVAHAGDNEVVAVVYKWSTATFLECQDMFRENGIFRDVLLYDLPKTYINDFFLRPTYLGDGEYRLNIAAEILGETSGWSLEFGIDGLDQNASLPAKERMSITLDKLRVQEWNAETPFLYTAWLRLKNNSGISQVVRVPLGFKRVDIKGEVFTFNGQGIKFKGVNHHDTDPLKGYCMRYEDYERDLRLMKEYNVNAIRTSHYPPDPHLLMLADELGFYVVDEADIETHGACATHDDIDLISNDKKWIPRYLDRVKRMLFRDRNHACVTMWSLGNESGGVHCQDACYAFLHAVHPEIPVHYEGGAWKHPGHYYDVNTGMYTHPNKVKAIGKREAEEYYKGKPYFLCEYVHAMGFGPGGLEEYWELFYRYDNLMGGCVWEWADHAVDHGENAKIRWTYGGDHGERIHDSNFCADGLFYPDRKPHTGALAMKNVYRPLRARALSKNKFAFTNTNRFADESCVLAWQLRKNGEIAAEGSQALAVPAMKSVEAALELPKFSAKNEYHIRFLYLDAEGREIADEELALQECFLPEAPVKGATPVLHREKSTVVVEAGEVVYSFQRKTGALRYFTVSGRQLLTGRALQPNITRAFLDNDGPVKKSLEKLGLLEPSLRHEGLQAEECDDGVCVTAVYSVCGMDQAYFTATVQTKIIAGGAAEITARLEPTDAFGSGEIPRFGLTLPLERDLENLQYFGLGSEENLPDLRAHTHTGIHATTVQGTHEPYIKPQENGTRCACRWLNITSKDGGGLRFCNAPTKFAFTAHNYSPANLAAAKHQEDLKDDGTTYLCIDGFVRGTGTASCGPETLDAYRIRCREALEFSFRIAPIQ
ncbi:MAG: hypothetical protein LBC83_04470 [Oscillospiraceae bacterium]|jgi:beta-galactosidase/beta-glucuronidase|nr:hypothetical protein [Oscillospiraceae bacterium]